MGSARLRQRPRQQNQVCLTLKVRRMSITSCASGRETSIQSKGGYKCLPARADETCPHHVLPLTSLSLGTRAPLARCSIRPRLAQAPLGLGRLGPRSPLLAPSPHPPPPAPAGPCMPWSTLPPTLCRRKPSGGQSGKAGGIPRPFKWPPSNNRKTTRRHRLRDACGGFLKGVASGVRGGGERRKINVEEEGSG